MLNSNNKKPIKNLISRNHNYIYVYPDNSLREYISHYTFLFDTSKYKSDFLNIIPDLSGCLVFCITKNQIISSLWGASTQTVTVTNNIADKDEFMFFIEFLPAGLYKFTGMPQIELLNIQAPLNMINKNVDKKIKELIETTSNINEFITKTDHIMHKEFEKNNENNIIYNLIENIKTNNGILSVKDLTDKTSYSSRHLNRVSNEYIGTNLKEIFRLYKINYIIKTLKTSNLSLTELAYSIGYYDQSHFNKDFKKVTGVTPGEYLKMMSVFYNEKYKF